MLLIGIKTNKLRLGLMSTFCQGRLKLKTQSKMSTDLPYHVYPASIDANPDVSQLPTETIEPGSRKKRRKKGGLEQGRRKVEE